TLLSSSVRIGRRDENVAEPAKHREAHGLKGLGGVAPRLQPLDVSNSTGGLLVVGVGQSQGFSRRDEIVTSSHFDFNFPEGGWQSFSRLKRPFEGFPKSPSAQANALADPAGDARGKPRR